MKFKVGDKVVVSPKANPLLGGLSGIVIETQESPIADTAYYKVDLDEERVFPEHHLIAETEYRFLTGLNATAHQLLATCGIKAADSDTKVLRAKDGTIIGDFNTGGTVSIHDLPTSEWYNPMRLTFKNGSSIEALPNTSNIIQNTSDFCTGFRGGNIPKPLKMEVVKDRTKTMKDWMDSLTDAWAKLGCTSFIMSPDEIKKMEEKKMPTKFTFYTTDWTDIDKSNGKKIPMKTTYAYIGSYQDEGADTSCPVSEYDERIGCLIAAAKISAKKSNEAQMMYNIARNTWGTELSWAILFELANTALNGNFERTYKKFHNDNIRFEKKRLTCSFCGKVFDTVEEKQAHEAWHVERKKARRERYLLRKRAKEIAFEEQAQKMAKEMIKEDK